MKVIVAVIEYSNQHGNHLPVSVLVVTKKKAKIRFIFFKKMSIRNVII